MKIRSVAVLFLVLTGCADLSERQRTWIGIGAGVLIVGAITAHEADSGKVNKTTVATPSVNCSANPALCQ